MSINASLDNSVYVFIDASNVWQAQKARGKVFDYQKLKTVLQKKYNAVRIRIFYYTAYPAKGTRDYDLTKKHDFFTYLKKGLGFTVVKKELKRIVVHGDGADLVKEKGNMDVEMTIDAIHTIPNYNIAIFFTGDSDFMPLITYIRNTGRKVYIYSSKNNISQELRTGADGYQDILLIPEDIWGRNLGAKG